MHSIVLVALGGGLGAVARRGLGLWIGPLAGEGRFPYATFAVNLAGCLLAGVLAGLVERFDAIGSQARLFLLTGLLGGFTTFSAFGLETVQLLRRGEMVAAALDAGGSLLLGLVAVWLGMRLPTVLPR